jgi:hypothetical protein
MTPTNPQRWARGLQHLLWKRPGLPRDWVPVLERHPGKVRSVDPGLLEFTDEPPAPGAEVP